MNSRCWFRSVAQIVCAGALLCGAAGVLAQTLYQQADYPGSVALIRPADTTPSMLADPEVVKAPLRNSRLSSRRAATIEANEAARRLKQARQTRERGALPLAGEQERGAAVGAVNYRYWQRQEKLRRLVEEALRRSNETSHTLQASR